MDKKNGENEKKHGLIRRRFPGVHGIVSRPLQVRPLIVHNPYGNNHESGSGGHDANKISANTSDLGKNIEQRELGKREKSEKSDRDKER